MFSLEYASRLFKKETVERFATHYLNVLKEVTEHPEKRLSEIDMLSQAEMRQILVDFNDTKAEYPSDKTVVELFEEQVEKTPERVAVVYEDEEITYEELNRKVNQLAYKLRELGVRPDEKVAIITQRSIEMIIGIYGIIKAGGAYVPIDPDYPYERIKYMLEDCQPKAILVGKAEVPVEMNIPVIDLFDEEVYTGETKNPEHVNTPNDLIYIIYTSGTTGKPKGVMIEHRGVINFCNVHKSSLY